MATQTLNTKIKLRYDTLANWTANDPVLLAGEVAITTVPTSSSEMQTTPPAILFKVGDGTSKWSVLPYASGLAADVYPWAKTATKPTYTAAEVGATTTAAVATQITTEINKLDKTDTAVNGQYVSAVSEKNGIITVSRAPLPVFTDTDTQYQLVLTGHTLKLQSKAKGASSWTDVSGQSFTLPDNDTTYTFASGTTNGSFTVTPSGGTAQSVAVYGLKSAAFTESTAYDAAGAANAVLGTASDAASVKTVYGAIALANSKYTKPASGITKTDLASGVQASLGLADTALQKADITSGSANGTISVGGSDVAVKGLAALAYKASLSKADVGLGNVENKTMDTTVTASSTNYISSGAVKTYVDAQIGGLTTFDVQVVQTLPTTGVKGVIYLVPHSHDSGDSYDEYIWNTAATTPAFEKIGNTDIDLSGYVPTTRTVNGKALSTDITLNASDVSAVGTVTSGSANGTIAVDGTDVAVKGLAALAYKASLTATDIPNLPASKITSGTFSDARIASAATWNAKQDALSFMTAPSTTNKVATAADIPTALKNPNALTIAGLSYDGSAAQTIAVDGTYNATSNKIATVSTVTSAISGANKTFTANEGLKVTTSGNTVTYGIDTATTVIFDCGDSTTV